MAIFVLAFGVVILLLITFANVAGLMIARAANRQREVAVRVALGASRLRLLRQGLAESFVLSIIGSILGVAFALGSMPVIRHFVPQTIAAWAHPEMNWTVLLFSVLVCVTAALAFGLFGQSAAAARPQEALSQGRRSSTDARQKLRSALVTGEIALTTIILTSTGLLGGAFWKLAHTDLGFNPDSVLTMRTELPVSAQTPYREDAGITGYVWHSNRHTFCSWLAMAGASIKEIQEAAGHKSITMSARYSHLSPAHKLSVVERIASASE